ncbi:hypothetical protein JCM14469_30730 [Desulfatiferula olefinivorans]
MSETPNDAKDPVVSACLTEGRQFLDEAFDRFLTPCAEHLEAFSRLLGQSVQSDEGDDTLSAEDLLCRIWTRIDDFLDHVKEISDFKPLAEIRVELDKEGQDRFHRLIGTFPRSYELVWNDDFFKPGPKDSQWIRTYKSFRRLRRSLSHAGRVTANVFRSTKKPPSPQTHVLNLQHFLRLHFLIPYSDLISGCMDLFLARISDRLLALHAVMSDHTLGFLGLGEEKSNWIRDVHDRVQARMAGPGPDVFDPAALSASLESVKAEWLERFDAFAAAFETEWAHAAQFSGTPVLPHGRYGRRRFLKAQARQRRTFNHAQDLWVRHFEGEGRDWTHDVALSRIQVQVAKKTLEILASVSSKITGRILPQCEHAVETLMKTRQRLGGMEQAGEWHLKKTMIQESRTLVRDFRRELLPAIANRVLGSGIGQDLSALSRLARDKANNLAENHVVFKKRDDHIPPQSETAEIPIRELFTEEFLIAFQARLDTFQQGLRIRLDDTVNGMNDIREVVEFNLESSFALLDKEDYTEEAYQMVVEGIDRSIRQLNELMDQVRGLPDSIGADLGEIAYGWIVQIQKLLDNEKLIALKLKLAKAKAAGRLKRMVHDLAAWVGRKMKALRAQGRKAWEKGREWYQDVRINLGFSPPDEDSTIQFTQFLIETAEKLKALPFVYQQLFQIEPLTDDRLFYGREAERKTLTDDMAALDTSGGMACALVGERGSGKTTLINMLTPEWSKHRTVHVLNLKETLHDTADLPAIFHPLRPDKPFDTLDDLCEFLMSDGKPPALVVENLQKLFLKTMDGFDLLDQFAALINHTRSRVAWVCSCTLYGWEYLDKAADLSRAFDRVVTLKPFSGEDIESMILSRHRMTGYQLKFLISRVVRMSRPFRKLSSETDRQAYLRKKFFDQIQSVASGNISVAILFWLRSIQSIEEHELRLASQVQFNVTFLSHLNTEDRFTLGAIVQHDTLTIDDHAAVFRQSADKSRLALQNLTRMGILQQEEGLFRVHPFLYRHVIRFLKLQNILH